LSKKEEPMKKAKALKRIPSDLVSYVLIEGEAVRDANDKMLIVSYAHSKLDIVDYYLRVLESGDEKYAVPHSKEHLLMIKSQLQAAIKKIMDRPIPSPSHPSVSVDYPKGYEG
jgi:hypothetical protein